MYYLMLCFFYSFKVYKAMYDTLPRKSQNDIILNYITCICISLDGFCLCVKSSEKKNKLAPKTLCYTLFGWCVTIMYNKLQIPY